MLPVLLFVLLQNPPASGLRGGLQALQRGDLDNARTLLEEVSRQEPGNAVTWAALAQVYLKSNQRERAMEAAHKAGSLAPEAPSIQHALAMFYAGAGDPDKAAVFEKRFAGSTLSDPGALARSASLYLQGGNSEEAIATAKQAIAQQETPALHNLLARAFDLAKQPSLALTEYRAAVSQEPENPEFCFDLAQALFPLDRFTEAAAVLEKCAKTSPSNQQIQLALGVSYYGLRRFPQAIDAFLRTNDLAPAIEQPYLFLSKMLDQAGDSLPRIRERFEELRARHPESYLSSLLMVKVLLLGDGTPAQIEPLLHETIAKNATLWEPHADLGDLLSRRHDYVSAAAELESAAKLNPAEPSIPFRLARVYDRLNFPNKAALQRARHKQLLMQPNSGMSSEARSSLAREDKP